MHCTSNAARRAERGRLRRSAHAVVAGDLELPPGSARSRRRSDRNRSRPRSARSRTRPRACTSPVGSPASIEPPSCASAESASAASASAAPASRRRRRSHRRRARIGRPRREAGRCSWRRSGPGRRRARRTSRTGRRSVRRPRASLCSCSRLLPFRAKTYAAPGPDAPISARCRSSASETALPNRSPSAPSLATSFCSSVQGASGRRCRSGDRRRPRREGRHSSTRPTSARSPAAATTAVPKLSNATPSLATSFCSSVQEPAVGAAASDEDVGGAAIARPFPGAPTSARVGRRGRRTTRSCRPRRRRSRRASAPRSRRCRS